MSHDALFAESTSLSNSVRGMQISGGLSHSDRQARPSGIGLWHLPRELRDQIYEHLLAKTYCVRLHSLDVPEGWLQRRPAPRPGAQGSTRTVPSTVARPFAHPQHPNFLPAEPRAWQPYSYNGDTVAPWSTLPSRNNREDRWHPRKVSQDTQNLSMSHLPPLHMREQWNLAKGSDTISILRTSKDLNTEAAPILCNKSNFLFYLSSPKVSKLAPASKKVMQNIEIYIDLLSAYRYCHDLRDQALTLDAGSALIQSFAADGVERKLCLVNVDYCETLDFVRSTIFAVTVEKLTNFETVALSFTPAYKQKQHRRLYSTGKYKILAGQLHEGCMASLETLQWALGERLGPCEVQFDEDFYRLVFHPRAHVAAKFIPKPDIDCQYGTPDRVRSPRGDE